MHILTFAGVFAATFSENNEFMTLSWNKWMCSIYVSGIISLVLNVHQIRSSPDYDYEKFRNWLIFGAIKTLISIFLFVPMHLGCYTKMLNSYEVSEQYQTYFKFFVFMKITGISVYNHCYRYKKETSFVKPSHNKLE